MGGRTARGGGLAGLARLLGEALGSLRRPGPGQEIMSALRGLGADYAGYSADDARGIGLDLSRSRLLLAERSGSGETKVAELSVGAVRSVRWERAEIDASNAYGIGPAALAGTVQATAVNATARRQALARSGLFLELSGSGEGPYRICLDGRADRLALWADLVERARDGTLDKPEAPVTA